ncbi:hypothetical protein, conserved [Eimeria maxima]|uniref:Lipase maturation factor 2 n=1 Tax=Eimeria maxima TaxID=5804 RepID=U6M6M4_EIMMA|nr:hypothetical protein, conserved [Eimeria maxima]CDJ59666.1 hypothetical protein, conserved [Eimeria maxima]
MSCLIFATAPFRVAAAISILGLCGGVLLSGNLGFLPHLAVALCLSLSDDSLLNAAAPAAASLTFLERCALMAGRAVLCTVVGVYFLIYTAGCLNYFCKIWMRPSVSAPSWVLALCRELSLLSICNGYGLFSVVTTGRLELVVEELHQTADRRPQWREVFLPFKPGDVNSSPPWLFSGHFPRLDWRLWFIPLRLKSALKGAVAGTPSLLQQQQLQQQQMSLNAPSPACDSCGHGASPAPAQDDPLQLYPPFWRAFVNQLSSRQPAVLQLLGQQGEVLKQLPPPVAVKVSLYDYRMTPPEGVPAYAAFFPQGWTHLTPQEILKLEKDLVHWTIGRWWMRRKQHDLDFFVFSKSCPPLEELCQY